MRIGLGFGFALLLAACGGSHPATTTTPPPATTPATPDPAATQPTAAAPSSTDCATAVNFAMDQMVAASQAELQAMPPDQRKQAEDMLNSLLPKMKAATADVCTMDKWSPTMIQCVGTTKNEADFGKCAEMLTADQKAHAQQVMNKVMTDSGVGGGPPPSSPPAP